MGILFTQSLFLLKIVHKHINPFLPLLLTIDYIEMLMLQSYCTTISVIRLCGKIITLIFMAHACVWVRYSMAIESLSYYFARNNNGVKN